MKKSRLEEIRIRPQGNGGHKVSHHYTSTPRLARGALSGGMTMDKAAPDEFNFKAGDQNALMKHLASALALKAGGAAPGQDPNAGED